MSANGLTRTPTAERLLYRSRGTSCSARLGQGAACCWDAMGGYSCWPGSPIHTLCLSAHSFLEGLEKKTTKPYQDESAQHFLGPHFIWGIHTCTPTPSHVPATAPGTNPTSPGTSIHYSPPTLRPGVRHPATSEVPGHTLDLQEAPAFPEGSCAAAAPALPAGSRSMSLLWAELLQALAVSRTQHPKKMLKRVLFTMERAGKALAGLEPGVLKAPADNSQKDFK